MLSSSAAFSEVAWAAASSSALWTLPSSSTSRSENASSNALAKKLLKIITLRYVNNAGRSFVHRESGGTSGRRAKRKLMMAVLIRSRVWSQFLQQQVPRQKWPRAPSLRSHCFMPPLKIARNFSSFEPSSPNARVCRRKRAHASRFSGSAGLPSETYL